MTLLKNVLFLVFTISMPGLTACKKDKCTAPDIAVNIIGTWEESFSGDTVEFKADGTLIDENDALLGTGAMSNKTYVITGTDMELTAVEVGNASTLSVTFTIESNECNKVKLGVPLFGLTTTLTRK